MFILDGLRAKDISRALESGNAERAKAINDQWTNPLEMLGQNVLALEMKGREQSFVQFCEEASLSKNATLAGDILASAARCNTLTSFNHIAISSAALSTLNLANENLTNFVLNDAIVDHLILPGSPPDGVAIQNSIISKVSGAASYTGLPVWVTGTEVDKFDSVQTVAEIRKAGLSPSQEVLISILKKTFLQKGGGRKEEALLRGFGAGVNQNHSQKSYLVTYERWNSRSS